MANIHFFCHKKIMSINSNKAIKEFNRIKNLGFVENIKPNHHDGSAGNTFEHYLGVKENNLKDPDFLDFEVKTKKKKSSSWISLFTLKPDSPKSGDKYMRDNFGINDEEYPQHKCFRTSLYAHRWSIVYGNFKYKVTNAKKENKIYITKADMDENILDKNVFWNYSSITQGIKKLKNAFFVNYEVKKTGNKYFYKYTNATIFLDYIGDSNFYNLLDEGIIRYDNRLGIYRSGEKKGLLHNHGGGFRANPKNIDKLYKSKIEV